MFAILHAVSMGRRPSLSLGSSARRGGREMEERGGEWRERERGRRKGWKQAIMDCLVWKLPFSLSFSISLLPSLFILNLNVQNLLMDSRRIQPLSAPLFWLYCVVDFRFWSRFLRGRFRSHLTRSVSTDKPKMVNAPEGLDKVILRKMKRFDCKTNQVSSRQLASF